MDQRRGRHDFCLPHVVERIDASFGSLSRFVHRFRDKFQTLLRRLERLVYKVKLRHEYDW